MATKGVFFDLYGTLITFTDVSAAWSDWLTALHQPLVPWGLAMNRDEFAGYCDGFFARPEPPMADDGFTVYERRMNVHLAPLGLNLRPEQVKAAAASALDAWHSHGRLDPEAHSVLENFGRTMKLALISNFDQGPHVHAFLDKEGLTPYFDLVVVSDDVGIKKPDPRIFHLALDRTGLDPREVVHVGDMADDIDGARAAGITPVLIRRTSADVVVPDFRVRPHEAMAVDADGVCVIPALSALRAVLNES